MGFADTIIPSPNPEPPEANPQFSASGAYADAQSGAEIQETCDPLLSYYITNIVVSTETAGWIQLISGELELIPPIYLGDNGSGGPTYTTPIQVPAGGNICVSSSVTGNHSVMVNGYLAG